MKCQIPFSKKNIFNLLVAEFAQRAVMVKWILPGKKVSLQHVPTAMAKISLHISSKPLPSTNRSMATIESSTSIYIHKQTAMSAQFHRGSEFAHFLMA